jgi:hypothetical protein
MAHQCGCQSCYRVGFINDLVPVRQAQAPAYKTYTATCVHSGMHECCCKLLVSIKGYCIPTYLALQDTSLGAPLTQVATALASWASLPQAPQLWSSLLVSISHPSAGLLLQSANLQWVEHTGQTCFFLSADLTGHR